MVEKTKFQIKWPSANITVRLNEGLRYKISAFVLSNPNLLIDTFFIREFRELLIL